MTPAHLARLGKATRQAAALLALLAAVSCTGDGGSGGDGPAPDSVGGYSREIFVASGRDVTGKGSIRQQLIDNWNAEQKTKDGDGAYQAHLVELSGSADQQRSQLLGALQSGGAKYDVVNLDVTWIPEFATNGLIQPLGKELIDSDVIESVAATAWWDGEVYSVPFNSDVGLLYYRRDYLKAAGLKNTDLRKTVSNWHQLQTVIGDVDARKPAKTYKAGWTTQLKAYEGRTVNAMEAFLTRYAEDSSAGGTKSPEPEDNWLVDNEGYYTGSAQELVSGVTEFRTRTSTNQAVTLDDSATSDEATSLSDFTAGRTAFLRHWPYAYGALHQTFTKAQLGVMALPGKAVLGGQNLAVTKEAPNAKKAAELIDYLTDEKSERCLLSEGFAATRRSAYTDEDLTCPIEPAGGSASPGSGEGTDRTPRDDEGRPAYAVGTLLPALEDAVQRPRTPYYGAFTQAVQTSLEPLMKDNPTSDAGIANTLDQELRKALPTRD